MRQLTPYDTSGRRRSKYGRPPRSEMAPGWFPTPGDVAEQQYYKETPKIYPACWPVVTVLIKHLTRPRVTKGLSYRVIFDANKTEFFSRLVADTDSCQHSLMCRLTKRAAAITLYMKSRNSQRSLLLSPPVIRASFSGNSI